MVESRKYLSPDILARIAGLELRAERVVEGTVSGLHVSPYYGASVDFADYREYVPGDDIKRLDWRVYGRTNRFYVKEYEDESNLHATILMDASASMAYGSGAMTKYDYGATLAASLTVLLIRQQDAVGLAMFDTRSRVVVPPSATQGQQATILRLLEEETPEHATELGDVVWALGDALKRRGLIVIVSDCLTDPERLQESLGRLRYQGHEVMIFHLLDPDELRLPFQGSVRFVDIEGEEEVHAEPWAFRKDYQEAMQEFVESLRAYCRRQRIDYELFTTDSDLGLGLAHFLHRRRTRLKTPMRRA